MELAQIDDTITVRVVGIDPNGIPNAVEVEYVRNGQKIYPGLAAGWWASLRRDLFDALWKWWWWIDAYLGKGDDNA